MFVILSIFFSRLVLFKTGFCYSISWCFVGGDELEFLVCKWMEIKGCCRSTISFQGYDWGIGGCQRCLNMLQPNLGLFRFGVEKGESRLNMLWEKMLKGYLNKKKFTIARLNCSNSIILHFNFFKNFNILYPNTILK